MDHLPRLCDDLLSFLDRAVRIAPFSNRLAHAAPPYTQGLRCLCNFEALRFSEPIRMLAAKMVDRMVKKSSKSGGRYVSVHLRFEEVFILLYFAFVHQSLFWTLMLHLLFFSVLLCSFLLLQTISE